MTSKPVALLMANLGVTKTHSRPHVSDDNPYSESQFKTLKLGPHGQVFVRGGNAKGFTCWEQFVAMLFCQVAHMNSLREVCLGLAGCESPLKHLGISTAPKRSTLAYANAHRPWELYESVFVQLLEKCQAETATRSRRKFRFKNKLMSLDGSIIELSATMFDWAKYRQRKGAIKLHLLLDHDGYLPSFAVVTEGTYSELQPPQQRRPVAGALARGARLVSGSGYDPGH